MRKSLLWALFLPAPLAAQSDNAISEAEDAFGTRVGNEQIGLYASGTVRGFDLAAAGNYRIDGAYFVKAADPAPPALANTTTRLGVNALRYDFTAPSGIVEYQLGRAGAEDGGRIEAGFQSYGTEFVEADLSLARRGALSLTGGVQIFPDSDAADGAEGDYYSVALVPRVELGGGADFAGIASWSQTRWGADAGFLTTGPFLPPKVERRLDRGADWIVFEARHAVAGGALRWRPDPAWLLRASTYWSDYRLPQSDFILYVTDREGRAKRTAFTSDDQRFTAWSSEAVAARDFRTGDIGHRLIAMARYRLSRGKAANGNTIPLGPVDLFAPLPEPEEPDPSATGYRRDQVEQWTLGGGYRVSFGDRLDLRADGAWTDYRKSVREDGGLASAGRTRLWLYSASALANLTGDLSAFASMSRGLEESSSAPRVAANRGEVLPAVEASQKEIGFKYRLGRLSLVGDLFDTRKALPGIDPQTGRYDLVGEARHRGAELSLAGAAGARLDVVLGAQLIDARLSGPLVEAGAIGRTPAGRSELVLLANADWRPPGTNGLSLDLNVNHQGRRAGDAANSFFAPAFTELSLGARYAFDIDGRPLQARLRVLNLLDDYAWIATPSNLLFYSAPRAVWASLTAPL